MSGSAPFQSVVERARAGDAESLDELARRFYPAVQELVHHRLAADLRRGRSWVNAHFSTGDVVQSVFESVLSDVRAFQGTTEAAFVGYLAAIVHHRVIDALRFHEAEQRDARRSVRIDPGFDAESVESDPADAAMSAEEVAQLRTALARFDIREQHLVRARMQGATSFRELAEQLGYGSEAAARRAFFDAQARLVLWLRTTD